MDIPRKRIGIALSGGGNRAVFFHLGVLKWMAENNMLENVVRISSVSGGSLGVGLIYAHNKNRWPTSAQYLNEVLPKIIKVILNKDIQSIAIRKFIFSPWWWNKKVNLIAKVLRKHWGITGELADLEKSPLWFINCTTFETGKRFRFTQYEMSDYQIGRVDNPKFSIADAVASSAGFPILIGPYKLRVKKYLWKKPPYAKKDWAPPKEKFLHLWDGGVYDNLGLESVYKMEQGGCLCDGIDYIIVSDASGTSGYRKRKCGFSGKNLKRILDIAMDQVEALRARDVVDYIKRTKNGLYFNIGNSAEAIAEASRVHVTVKDELVKQCMSPEDADKARRYSIQLSKPSEADFWLVFNHGYEVAKCTHVCYGGSEKDPALPDSKYAYATT